MFFIHLCSGPRQDGDLCHWVESLSSLHEVNVMGLCIDPLAADWQQRVWFQGCGAGDLLNEQHAFFLLDLIQSGKVCGGFASPPYKTFSRAVHVVECTNQQPRQLRARSSVWDALECCTARERHAVYNRIHSGLDLFGPFGGDDSARCMGWVGSSGRCWRAASVHILLA